MTSLLGLNLLLLAFFILLNALSTREAIKTDAVLESVHRSFNSSLLVAQDPVARQAAEESLPAGTRVQVALGHLFQSMLPMVHKEDTPRGPVMRMELSAGTFFGAGRTSFQPGRRLLLERLAVALDQAAQNGVDYEFVLMHSAGGGAAEAALATERVGAMAAELSRHGVATDRLSVGLFPASAAKRGPRVRLVLRVQRPGPVSAVKAP